MPEEPWGTLGVEGSDTPPARVPTERGDYGRFYTAVAATIRDGAPPPVDPGDALAALRIIAERTRSRASDPTPPARPGAIDGSRRSLGP